MAAKLEANAGKVKIKKVFSCSSAPTRLPLRLMTTHTFYRHAHTHHGLTGRGALLRVHVRL